MVKLKKYYEIIGALLAVFIAIVWLGFPTLEFHVFFTIEMIIMLGVLSKGFYVINAQDKKTHTKKDKNLFSLFLF